MPVVITDGEGGGQAKGDAGGGASFHTLWRSIREYVPAILRWWWVTLALAVGGMAGWASNLLVNIGGVFNSLKQIQVPDWVPTAAVVLGLFVAQFLAFHKLRERQDEEQRKRESNVLGRIVIRGRSYQNIAVAIYEPGCPVTYPINILNHQPLTLEIVFYSVTILWDGVSVQKVEWRSHSTTADNGLPIHSPELDTIEIPPDSDKVLQIPVNMAQVSQFPSNSPKWGASGALTIRHKDDTRPIHFNLPFDEYQMTQELWEQAVRKATLS